MQFNLIRSRKSMICAWAVVGGVASSIALPAHADAFVLAPSLSRAGVPTALNGAKFSPNQAVTLLLRQQGGSDVAYSAVTNEQGALSYSVSVPSAGVYQLVVTDSGGRVLARTQFVALQ